MVPKGKVCISSFPLSSCFYELLLLMLVDLVVTSCGFKINDNCEHLDQGLMNYEPWIKSGQPPGFAQHVIVTFLDSCRKKSKED